MEIFTFEKCLLDRLGESLNVLSWKDEFIPASQVRLEWSYYIELQIESTGWQALWKIPRVICEEMGVRFPTVVFGMVEQVLFKELKAVFLLQAVQDDIHLPERHEVNLQDLWPTKNQENTEINIEKTAECIDQLRFFYTYVWMPWDSDYDDDLNWVEKHLESRIRFCYDIKKKNIKQPLSAHILTLLTEANYIHQRREYLEVSISDDEELSNTLNKSQINYLMRLHLRLNKIKNEIELLENPDLREIYEEIKTEDNDFPVHFKEKIVAYGINDFATCFIVTLTFNIEQQIQFLSKVQQNIHKDCPVRIYSSFQHVLNSGNASAITYLCPGKHAIKVHEQLNSNGKIIGLLDKPLTKMPIIESLDEDSSLLVFDGDFSLSNIVLDCHNVRVGIIVKQGSIKLKNCQIIGDGKSSTQQGIFCAGNSNLTLEDSSVENFSTGIKIQQKASITLKNSKVTKCKIGIDVNDKNVHLNFNKAKIIGSTKCGIYADSLELVNTVATNLNLTSLNQLKQYIISGIHWLGECMFEGCASNILISNSKMVLINPQELNTTWMENGTYEV